MPVHRVPPSDLDTLEATVAALEAQGEEVVQVYPWAGEWAIVTRPGKPKPPAKKTITRTAVDL